MIISRVEPIKGPLRQLRKLVMLEVMLHPLRTLYKNLLNLFKIRLMSIRTRILMLNALRVLMVREKLVSGRL